MIETRPQGTMDALLQVKLSAVLRVIMDPLQVKMDTAMLRVRMDPLQLTMDAAVCCE